MILHPAALSSCMKIEVCEELLGVKQSQGGPHPYSTLRAAKVPPRRNTVRFHKTMLECFFQTRGDLNFPRAF